MSKACSARKSRPGSAGSKRGSISLDTRIQGEFWRDALGIPDEQFAAFLALIAEKPLLTSKDVLRRFSRN